MRPLRKGKSGPAVMVVGEAGSGKTRLIHELATTRSGDARFLVADADGVLRKSLNPFSSMLRKIFEQSDQASGQVNMSRFDVVLNGLRERLGELSDPRAEGLCAELERTRSVLAAVIGLHREDSLFEALSPEGRSDNTIYALCDLVRAMSLIEPVVLVIDNAQWLDPESTRVVQVMMRNIWDFPVCLMVLSRPPAQGTEHRLPLEELEIVEERVELVPFDSFETRELLTAILGEQPSEATTGFVQSRTGGNPFFIEQLCGYLSSRGLLETRTEGLSIRELHGEIELPADISSVLIARLDTLSKELREAVQAASVLGREFEVLVLSAMLRSDGDIAPLLRAGEDEMIWSTLDELLYVFRHAMMRDVAYDMQMRSRLRELHSIAFDALESVHPDDAAYWSALAFHAEQAGVAQPTARYLRMAAERALSLYHNEETLDLLRRLEARCDPDGTGMLEVRNGIADALELLGRWSEAEEVLLANLELASGMAPDDEKDLQAGRSAMRLVRLHCNRGEFGRAEEYFESSSDILERLGDIGGLLEVYGSMGGMCNLQGRFEEAEAWHARQLEMARSAGDLERELKAIGSLGNVHLGLGQYEEALPHYREVVRKAGELGLKTLQAVSLGNMSIVYKLSGRSDLAEACLEKQLELASELGNKRIACLACGNMGNLKLNFNRLEKARGYYARTIELARELGARQHEAIGLANMANYHRASGSITEADGYIGSAVEIAREIGLTYYLPSFLSNAAEIRLAAGDPGGAMEMAEEGERAALDAGFEDSAQGLSILRSRIACELAGGVAMSPSGLPSRRLPGSCHRARTPPILPRPPDSCGTSRARRATDDVPPRATGHCWTGNTNGGWLTSCCSSRRPAAAPSPASSR